MELQKDQLTMDEANELFKEAWGNIHRNKTVESVLNLNRNTEDSRYIDKKETDTETSETGTKKSC